MQRLGLHRAHVMAGLALACALSFPASALAETTPTIEATGVVQVSDTAVLDAINQLRASAEDAAQREARTETAVGVLGLLGLFGLFVLVGRAVV